MKLPPNYERRSCMHVGRTTHSAPPPLSRQPERLARRQQSVSAKPFEARTPACAFPAAIRPKPWRIRVVCDFSHGRPMAQWYRVEVVIASRRLDTESGHRCIDGASRNAWARAQAQYARPTHASDGSSCRCAARLPSQQTCTAVASPLFCPSPTAAACTLSRSRT